MNTLAYVFILIALLIVRGVTKGRSITDIPSDLGDMFVAVVTYDTGGLKEVLSRTGETNTASDAATGSKSNAASLSGSDSSLRVGKPDKAALVAFGKSLQSQGYKVSEHPAFGGVHPVHVAGSKHYSGEAIDVNADNFKGGEKPALDKANAMAKAAGFDTLWQVAGHYDHLHVAVPS